MTFHGINILGVRETQPVGSTAASEEHPERAHPCGREHATDVGRSQQNTAALQSNLW